VFSFLVAFYSFAASGEVDVLIGTQEFCLQEKDIGCAEYQNADVGFCNAVARINFEPSLL
jgi:hypothetical protein